VAAQLKRKTVRRIAKPWNRARMTLPVWARGEPLGVFRAPWYNNWPASLYLALVFSVAFPIITIGRLEVSLLERIGTGIAIGIGAGVVCFPILSLPTFLCPVRVYQHGIRAFDEQGGPLSATWDVMDEPTESWSKGVPGFEITLKHEKRTLWIPTAILDEPRF
jgi:hypothetical protein